MRLTPILTVLLCACGAGDENHPVPSDYETSWTELQSCTEGSVHGGDSIRIFANASAEATWNEWAQHVADPPDGWAVQFEPSATLLKAQYSDAGCTTLKHWTMMTRLEAGAAPEVGDWLWEMVSANDDGTPGNVSAGGAGCWGCHQSYGNKDYVGSEPRP